MPERATTVFVMVALLSFLGLAGVARADVKRPSPSLSPSVQPSATTSPSSAESGSISQPEEKGRGWWPWEWPGRVKDAVFGSIGNAINDWFKGIVESALSPVFDLFSRTVFTTPDLAAQPRLVSLWRISVGIADAALVLFAVTGGAIVTNLSLRGRAALPPWVRPMTRHERAVSAEDCLGTDEQ